MPNVPSAIGTSEWLHIMTEKQTAVPIVMTQIMRCGEKRVASHALANRPMSSAPHSAVASSCAVCASAAPESMKKVTSQPITDASNAR